MGRSGAAPCPAADAGPATVLSSCLNTKSCPPTSISTTAPERFAAFICRAMKQWRRSFAQWLAPFRRPGRRDDLDFKYRRHRPPSFDGIGLPGFQFIQDEIEYDTRTHHSNMDVFDRIQADDMKQAATIMAAFVYQTAMRDEKIPRKPTGDKSRQK